VALALARRRSPLALWNVLDARWYVGIAQHGYHWTLDGKPALAFFPLYPLLLHIGAAAGVPAVAVGLLVANLAALAALFYLRSLVVDDWGEAAAGRAVWLVALFPTAFFTFAPYTEGLFVLSAAAVLYHARHAQWLRAGLWLAAALLTRSTAVILLLPVLMVTWGAGTEALLRILLPALVAAAGYVTYLFAWGLRISQILGAQRHWHRSLTWPWNGFLASIHFLQSHLAYNPGWTAEDLLQLGVTLLFLGLTAAAWRSLSPSVAVYCTAFWLLLLCTPEWLDGYFSPFSSADRFILALFPLAGWVAIRLTRRAYRLWLPLSAAVMLGAATVHLSGGWVG
jgi:hypothetical protein